MDEIIIYYLEGFGLKFDVIQIVLDFCRFSNNSDLVVKGVLKIKVSLKRKSKYSYKR